MSDWRFASRERVLAGPRETNTIEANIPMTAITTKSSISVKPLLPIFSFQFSIFIEFSIFKFQTTRPLDYFSIAPVYTVGWGQDKRTTLRLAPFDSAQGKPLAQGNLRCKLPARA